MAIYVFALSNLSDSVSKCHEELCICRNLMAQQDLRDLGFRTEQMKGDASDMTQERQGQTGSADSTSQQPGSNASERKRGGFIAGVRR